MIITKDVVANLFKLLGIKWDDTVYAAHKVWEDKRERYNIIFKWYLDTNAWKLTLNFTLFQDGWVSASMNRRVVTDGTVSYETVEYINELEDILVKIKSLQEFKPSLNIWDKLWL